MDSIIQILQNYGFERSTAKIYKLLVQNGESPVSDLIEMSELSRGGIYDAISSLQEKNLVQHRKDGRQALYKAENPDKLHYLKQEKENEVEQMNAQLESIIGQMKGEYNLAESKPGVRFFEGKGGVIEAYELLLTKEEDVYSIEDTGEMEEFIPEYAQEFIQKRIEKDIYNKVINPSSNPINSTSEEKKREVREIPTKEFSFSIDIKISGNFVLFTTLEKKTAVSVLIEHPLIAENFTIIFDFMWKHAREESDKGEFDEFQEEFNS